MRLLARPGPHTDEICLILLDQASLDWGSEVAGWSWPWPRELYAAVLSFCRRGGARSVTLDVLFTEASVYGVWDDQALGGALAARTSRLLCRPRFYSSASVTKTTVQSPSAALNVEIA